MFEFLRNRRYAPIHNTTGYNVRKILKIRVKVECKSVHRDPAADADAQCADFAFRPLVIRPYPNTGSFCHAVSGDVQIGTGLYNHFLQEPQVFAQIRKKPIQIQNRVAHQLPWTVVRDVASSVNLEKCGFYCFQAFVIKQQIAQLPIFAQRINMRMFHEQENIGHHDGGIGLFGCNEPCLKFLL